MDYKCEECDSEDILVEATMWIEARDDREPISADDLGYDRNSTAICNSCGETAELRCFEPSLTYTRN
jgi:hypothetical protein